MHIMSATPPPRWYNLIQTCLRKEPGPFSRFVQLATLSLDGHPAVRTVVFRGWYSTQSLSPSPSSPSPSSPSPSSTDLALMTTTDTRSQKMSQLNAHPFAEVCWYFQEARQQFRITGSVTAVDDNYERVGTDKSLVQQRIDVWKSLSTAARAQFLSPQPGAPRLADDQSSADSPSNCTPVDAFALLLVHAARVDFLDLRANQRIQFTKNDSDGTWSESDIYP